MHLDALAAALAKSDPRRRALCKSMTLVASTALKLVVVMRTFPISSVVVLTRKCAVRALTMPTSSPALLKTGPPELPCWDCTFISARGWKSSMLSTLAA